MARRVDDDAEEQGSRAHGGILLSHAHTCTMTVLSLAFWVSSGVKQPGCFLPSLFEQQFRFWGGGGSTTIMTRTNKALST
jgi:hypothetical protein